MFAHIPPFPYEKLLEHASTICELKEIRKRITILIYEVEIGDVNAEDFETIKSGIDKIKTILLSMRDLK